METTSNDYRISFFKPTIDSASKNTLVHVVSDLFVRISKQLKYYAIINP